jgi:IS6 family transposase
VDETYVKVAGRWRYVYRAVDQYGQIIDVYVSPRRHTRAPRNRIECDHGRLKARRRPMRGLKRDHSARVIMRGHALMQNVRRGHYEVGVDVRPRRRVAAAFAELARTM